MRALLLHRLLQPPRHPLVPVVRRNSSMRDEAERTFNRFMDLARELVRDTKVGLLERLSSGLSIEEKEKLIGKRGDLQEDDVASLVEEQSMQVAAMHKARVEQSIDAVLEDPTEPIHMDEDDKMSEVVNHEFDMREWDPSSGEIRDVDDPILGRYLYTLDSKRIYAADVPTLARIPVWEKQRVYRKERARKIAEDRKKRRRHGGDLITAFPGIITVYEKAWVKQRKPTSEILDDANELTLARQRFGILDGQHRVGAMRILHNQGEFTDKVLLEVYPLDDERAVSELFTDINKSEPVKDVDLPNAAISVKEKEMLQSATAALQGMFPSFFKESTRCRMPHVNVDNLRDDIYQADVLRKAELGTDAELLSWLLEVNERLSKRTEQQWLEHGDSASYRKALEKATKAGFFLGMDKSWLGSFVGREDSSAAEAD